MTAASPRMQPLFEKTKTVCFGHFLMEVPVSATVIFGPTNVDWPIEYFPGEAEKIAQHVAGQLDEIEKDRIFLSKEDITKFTRYGKVIDGALPGQKLIFGTKDQATNSIYSFIPLGKDLFIQRALRALSIDAEIKTMNTVASSLRLRTENEIPTENGACIEGGFVSWQPEFERIAIGIRLKEFPDVHLSISATRKDVLIESDALEPRVKRAEEEAKKEGLGWLYARIKTFRRGTRQLGDWNGFEILARKPMYKDDTDAHEFLFLSQGTPNDPLKPVLDIRLNTGVANNKTASVRPSISDEEAVALWDKLTTSIRIRPTGGTKNSSAESPKTPLGKHLRSGDLCTQTGWWQCMESDDIAGGKRRHFKAGETLPHMTLLGKPSLWQKLTGERPAFNRDTVWQLVAYDDASPATTPDTK
ncbi:hypothetical protein HSX11_20685 [Oxalobacteraceae bacterium]|nr:hypothetical protein [Oxalobacteraceae bacterium]